jgi:16S rRNA (uracil1498-N3)-methyltransferase
MLEGPVYVQDPPASVGTVAFAPTKGVKPEWVVQKLTELGIDQIALLHTERSVVTFSAERSERLLRRLESVVTTACMQSRRVRPAVILGVMKLSEFVALDGRSLLCDPSGDPLRSAEYPAGTPLSVAVGPEGGWSPGEAGSAPTVSLPGHILRADTAAVAAGVSLRALLSG